VPTEPLYLASASPRRLLLLQQLGLTPKVLPQEVDEQPASAESPIQYVQRIAQLKAQAALAQLPSHDLRPVLGADTCGELDGQLLLKPRDEADALTMLQAMSGREHRVLTAVSLINHHQQHHCIVTSRVKFRSISRAEIHAYWRTGEPHDKAGAYAIQGLGAIFVETMTGSYSSIVGLPLQETARLLHYFAIDVLTLAAQRE